MTVPIPSHEARPTALVSVLTLLVLVFVGLAAAVTTGAAGSQTSVGVTPATSGYVDPPLLPGGTGRLVLHLQQNDAEGTVVQVSTVALGEDPNTPHDWLSLDREGRLSLPAGTHRFTVDIQVPAGIPNGDYRAGVLFEVIAPEDHSNEGSYAITHSSVIATILMRVDDAGELKQMSVVGAATLAPTEVVTPLRATVPMANDGNVNAIPTARLVVKDRMQEQVLQTYDVTGQLMKPGARQDQVFVVDAHDLPLGQYWMEISILLDKDVIATLEPTPFDVLGEGEVARHAELRSIRIDGDLSRVVPGKMIKLNAVVQNTGEAPLVAQFAGEVLRDGEIVDALESRAVTIAPGATENLTMLYRVDDAGKYEFKGRVHYGSKVTGERSLLVEAVAGSTEATPSAGIVLVLLAGTGTALVASGRVSLRRKDRRSAP